jgi:hypothetical protein
LNPSAAADGFAEAFPLFAIDDSFMTAFAGFLISAAAATVLDDERR